MIRVAILVVSDRASRGEREDAAGPALAAALAEFPAEAVATEVVPDERERISEAVVRLAAVAELVLTTGGTGLSPRDVTPEATRDVLDREAPGFGEEMRRRSLERTPLAVVSRATAGTVGRTLVVNLPGSPGGAVECLGFLRRPILHGVKLLEGGETDCARDETGP